MWAEIFVTLNQPVILCSLLVGAIALVLIDYLLPVDWLAYVGYALFGLFVGATISAGATMSLLVAIGVIVLMLILHESLFSKYLTNAPRYEKPAPKAAQPKVADGIPRSDNL